MAYSTVLFDIPCSLLKIESGTRFFGSCFAFVFFAGFFGCALAGEILAGGEVGAGRCTVLTWLPGVVEVIRWSRLAGWPVSWSSRRVISCSSAVRLSSSVARVTLACCGSSSLGKGGRGHF